MNKFRIGDKICYPEEFGDKEFKVEEVDECLGFETFYGFRTKIRRYFRPESELVLASQYNSSLSRALREDSEK